MTAPATHEDLVRLFQEYREFVVPPQRDGIRDYGPDAMAARYAGLAKYQQRLAKAIAKGVKTYFQRMPPPGTLLAERRHSTQKHVITRGDTLSEIADRYDVSVAALRRTNRLRSKDLIRIGQVLVIPES